MKSTPRSWPEEVRQAARSLYLRRSTVGEVSTTLGVPVRTLYNWVEAGRWDDLLSHEGTEEATARRLAVLIEREAKQADDLSCLLYTSPSPRDRQKSRMPSSA